MSTQEPENKAKLIDIAVAKETARAGFLITGALFLAANAWIAWYYYRHGEIKARGAEEAMDFIAYCCPILATGVAGVGIYFEDRAKPYFVTSILILLVGLLCYAAAHDVPQGIILGFGQFNLAFAVCLIGYVISKQYTERRAARVAVYGLFALAVVGIAIDFILMLHGL